MKGEEGRVPHHQDRKKSKGRGEWGGEVSGNNKENFARYFSKIGEEKVPSLISWEVTVSR